jgi:AraC-like DNA-binding protein
MDRIRITHTIYERFKALGIPPSAILRQAGLPPALFQQKRVFVTTAQWFALWQALEPYIDDPGFGLKLTNLIQHEPYEPLSITALSAPSFYGALSKVARYKRLFSAEDICMREQGNVWSVEVLWLATADPVPPLLLDAVFSHIISLGQRGTGRDLRPDRVLFQREAAHRSMYEAYFQCPVEFGADRDALLLSHEAMMQPFLSANPDLLDLLEPQLEAALRERDSQPGFIEQVKRLIRSRIAGQPPTIQEIARELLMSTRTLQRRLSEEDVQFQQLLDVVRHEMAKEYLRASLLELGEIAFLLGYREASSFHRAFQHWEGRSPGQWRAAQRQPGG